MERKVALLVVILCLSAFPPVCVMQSSARPKVYLDPGEFVADRSSFFNFTYPPISSSYYQNPVIVSIKAANWTEIGVCGYDFKLYYNNTLLEALAELNSSQGEIVLLPTGIPEDCWLKPDMDPNDLNIIENGTIHHSEGFVHFSCQRSAEPPETGNGTLGLVGFRIIQVPTNISCALELRDVHLYQQDTMEIPLDQYDIFNGRYQYRLPPAVPVIPSSATVYLDPPTINVSYPATFTVDVNVRNVTDLYAWQIKITFDPRILEVVDVVHGDWNYFVNASFTNQTEGWILLVDHLAIPSYPQPRPTINGNGTLARITFHTVGAGQCPLTLNTRLFNVDTDTISTPPYLADVNGDLKVNLPMDLAYVAKSIGKRTGEPGCNPSADFDHDGLIGVYDFLCCTFDFGKSYNPPGCAMTPGYPVYPVSSTGQPVEIGHQVQGGLVAVPPFSVTWRWLNYTGVPIWLTANIIHTSSSPSENFSFNRILGQIGFNINANVSGFCNVTIPKLLMDGGFKVLINGTETASILTWNKTHSFVYFTYDQGLQNVGIVGEIVTRIRNIKDAENLPITDVTGDGIVNILDLAAVAVCNYWDEDR